MKGCYMKGYAVIGMFWGDEGKGAVVDALCRRYGAKLVIKGNGGCQASHTVQPDPRTTFRFHQFGSGTFAGATTYLDRDFMVDPVLLYKEAHDLRKIGISNAFDLVTIHPDCLVTTELHRVLAVSRRQQNPSAFNSCLMGVGQTREYWLQHGREALMYKDLGNANIIREKLLLMRERMIEAMFMNNTPGVEDVHAVDIDEIVDQLDVGRCFQTGVVKFDPVYPFVYEGNQGVLLDQYYGTPYYNTWSDTTFRKVNEFILRHKIARTNMLYIGVMRAYCTRHGDGVFPTEGHPDAGLFNKIRDPNNPHNPGQGDLRFGWLDLVMLQYAVNVCGAKLDGVIVNHIDQLPDQYNMCSTYMSRYGSCVEYAAKVAKGAGPIAVPKGMWQVQDFWHRVGKVVPIMHPYKAMEDLCTGIEVVTGARIYATGRGPGIEGRAFR
jgi:adenylosuccinate synthase